MKKIVIDNKYELGNGMGCWAKSYENYEINEGEVRFIDHILMYAYQIYPPSFWSFKSTTEVWWTPVDYSYNTPENLRKWINK